MLSSIQLDILEKLSKSPDTLTSNELAFSIGVGEKTVRKYINDMNVELSECGATIEIKQGKGIRLIVSNLTCFKELLDRHNEKALTAPESPDERINYILIRLLTTSKFISIYDFADEIYVSPSAVRKDIQQIKRNMTKVGLKIVHNRENGIKITGDETIIRNQLRRIIYRFDLNKDFLSDQVDISLDSIEDIKNIVTKAISASKVSLTNEAITSLAMHILIGIYRTENVNVIPIEPQRIVEIKNTEEYSIASRIQKETCARFGIELPENEIAYIAMHISGRKNLHNEYSQTILEVDSEEANIVYNLMLRSLLKNSDIDFFGDSSLRINLLLHIIPFLERLKNNMQMSFSSLNNIKDEYPYAYELSVTAMSAVSEYYHKEISQEEISYFAIHYILALDRKLDSKTKANILIITPMTFGVSQLISYRLNKRFADFTNIIKFIEEPQLADEDVNGYDLLLTTEKLTLKTNIPCIKINPILDDDDLKNIENFFLKMQPVINFSTLMRPELFEVISDVMAKDELIKKQITLINKTIHLPDNFYDLVIQREIHGSTEYNNKIAIPHPIKTDNTIPPFISVYILKKPVVWINQQVQIIFMFSINNRDNNTKLFFERLSKIIRNERIAQRLINCTTYDEFMSEFAKNC